MVKIKVTQIKTRVVDIEMSINDAVEVVNEVLAVGDSMEGLNVETDRESTEISNADSGETYVYRVSSNVNGKKKYKRTFHA
jgi:hypothetical protein